MMATYTRLLKVRIPLLVLGAILLVGWLASRSPALAAEVDSPFPVRVSTNGRYLLDATGKPFLLHGDTAWTLIVQLTKEEAEEYLENRRQKGFNSIITTLLEPKWADNRPQNRNGDAPFTTLWDFSTPNEAYFAHVDWVVRKARDKGILIVLNPCDISWASPNATRDCSRRSWPTGRPSAATTGATWVSVTRTTPTSSGWREEI